MYSPKVYEGKGAFLWRIASPLYDSGGTVIGAIETIRDVTGRKEAEEKLRSTHEELNAAYEQLTATEEELRQNYEELPENQQALVQSEERYRNVVEDQTEFICRFTPDGRLTFVNGAYCRYFGLDAKTCLGKPHTVVIPPDDLARDKTAPLGADPGKSGRDHRAPDHHALGGCAVAALERPGGLR